VFLIDTNDFEKNIIKLRMILEIPSDIRLKNKESCLRNKCFLYNTYKDTVSDFMDNINKE